MNSRPPCERDPRKDKNRQHVDAEAAKLPERLFPQDLAGPWQEKNGPHENREAVLERLPGHHVFLRLTGPERRHNPTDDPQNPDDGEQLGGPGSRPAAPGESQQLTRIVQHVADHMREWINRQTGARCEAVEGEYSASSPIQADCGWHQADAQWFPATQVRRRPAHSPALVVLSRSTRPLLAMRYERLRPYRTGAGASRDRR